VLEVFDPGWGPEPDELCFDSVTFFKAEVVEYVMSVAEERTLDAVDDRLLE